MGKTERRRTFLWILGLLLMLQAIAAFCFCMKKTGFHYDEYYSYYSSNVSVGLAPSDREWKTGESIRNEFQVLPEERFRFRDVVRMQTYDVHPPVYYLLLHAVCSLTLGIFTKWSGLALNLLFFAGSWCLVALLAWKISGKKKEIVLGSCLLYGFCPAILSGVALVRMYMLLGFWILLLTWLHVKALETRRRGWRFYIPAAVTVYLGFLTHYYFAVYLFFLAAAMECYLLFEQEEHKSWGKKWRDCFAYAAAVIGAMILAVLSYPACLGHIFRGYRGTEAMGAFFDLSNTLGRFRFFAGLLDEYGFGSCLPAFLLILILLLLTGAGAPHRGKADAHGALPGPVSDVPGAGRGGDGIFSGGDKDGPSDGGRGKPLPGPRLRAPASAGGMPAGILYGPDRQADRGEMVCGAGGGLPGAERRNCASDSAHRGGRAAGAGRRQGSVLI